MSKPLSELLGEFNKIPDEDFDPESHIGDIKDKVEGIKWRIDKWKADAKAEEARAEEMHQRWVKPYLDLAEMYERNIRSLEAYVLKQMLLNEWEELPGHTRRVQVQESTPALEIARPASAIEFLRYPKYVKQEIVYKWMLAEIKRDIGPEDKVPVEGATVRHGKHIRFYTIKDK